MAFGLGEIMAGSLIGGGLSLIGGESANRANRAIASDQMNFQRFMSDTAHQREVEDLRKAGLNPLLSANAGASTPAGASTTMTNTLSDLGDKIATSARESALFKQQQKINDSTINLNRATEALAGVKQITESNNAKAAAAEAERAKMQMEVDKSAQPVRLKLAPANEVLNTIGNVVGPAATATGAGLLLKKILSPFGGVNIPKGMGRTKKGDYFDIETGEIKSPPTKRR